MHAVADFYCRTGKPALAENQLSRIIDGKVRVLRLRRRLGPPATGDDPCQPRRLPELPESTRFDRQEPGKPSSVGLGLPCEGHY